MIDIVISDSDLGDRYKYAAILVSDTIINIGNIEVKELELCLADLGFQIDVALRELQGENEDDYF